MGGPLDFIFGGGDASTTVSVPEEQKAFIRKMIQREGELFPLILQMFGMQETGDTSGLGWSTQGLYGYGPGEQISPYNMIKLTSAQKPGQEPGQENLIGPEANTGVDVPPIPMGSFPNSGAIVPGGGGLGSLISQGQIGLPSTQIVPTRGSAPLPKIPNEAQDAYNALMSSLDPAFTQAQGALNTFNLPPEALSFLDNLRDERIGSMQTDADRLVGDAVADLAKRGMMSSTTSQGAMGDITKALQPGISQANQDYWLQRLQMPAQLASQKYNLAADYGSRKAGATQDQLRTVMDPLLALWQTTVGQGQGNMGSTTTSTPASPSLFQVGAGLAPYAFAASSRAYKTDIRYVDQTEDEKNLAELMGLKLARYVYKPEIAAQLGDDGREHLGLISEEAPASMRALDGTAINLYDMLAVLASAVRGLSREVRALKKAAH